MSVITEVENNIRFKNSCEMDTKIEIKEEDSLSDDVASQSDTEFSHEVVTVKRNSDDVLLDMAIKAEIKSETHFAKQLINPETVTCSNNWEIDSKTGIEQQTVITDFGACNEQEFHIQNPVMKLGKFNSDHVEYNNIQIKEEPWCLETETLSVCDDTKDGDLPPVKYSRLCMQESSLASVEVSGRETSFHDRKDHLFEYQKSETELPTTEKHVLSELSGRCTMGRQNYIRYLKQKSLIHKGKRHKCKTCDKSFTQLSSLKRHNMIHEGKKPHQCKTCDKSFTQLSNLKRHNMVHEGNMPHKCKICGKNFTDLSNLKRHILRHEDKKPHQCKICDKNFARWTHLKLHNLVHEGKKPHKCNSCDKNFTQLSHLNVHNSIHEIKKAHQCKICGKNFIWLSHLKVHNLIHEGKKPHQCEVCDKRFTKLSDLNRHNRIHEGKKPHKCQTCDKSFTRLSSLKRHILIHEDKQ